MHDCCLFVRVFVLLVCFFDRFLFACLFDLFDCYVVSSWSVFVLVVFASLFKEKAKGSCEASTTCV